MKMRVIIIFSFLLTCTLNAQVNLVLNPSFEYITECPDYHSQISKSVDWDKLRSGGGGSPDLFHECCLLPQYCGMPENHENNGYQYAMSGIGYAGIITSSSHPSLVDFREFIQGTLESKLVQGTTYCLTFYVSLSEYSQYACVSLGAYLDNGEVQSVNNKVPSPYLSPQVANTSVLLDDILNWVKIEGSFMANGTEEYVSIGNFSPDNSSGIVHLYDNPSLLEGSYYYIDDVSVIDMSTPAQAGNDTIIHPGESVFIGREPEIGLNEACIWFVDGVPIDTIAGMWVAPEETTTYVLQQTLCGEVKYDTVTVVVDEFAGVFEYSDISGDLILYPNPSTGEVWFDLKENTDDLRGIAIYSLEGMLLHTELPQGNKINFAFSSGAYIVVLTTKSASYRERVVIIN